MRRGTNVSALHIEEYRDVVGDGFDDLAKAGGAEIRSEGLEEGGVGLVGCRVRGCCVMDKSMDACEKMYENKERTKISMIARCIRFLLYHPWWRFANEQTAQAGEYVRRRAKAQPSLPFIDNIVWSAHLLRLTGGTNDGNAKLERLVALLLLGRLALPLAVGIAPDLGKQLVDVRIEADAEMRVDGGDALLELGEEGHCGSG